MGFHDDMEDGQPFSHVGGDGHLGRFARPVQAFMERSKPRMTAHGRELSPASVSDGASGQAQRRLSPPSREADQSATREDMWEIKTRLMLMDENIAGIHREVGNLYALCLAPSDELYDMNVMASPKQTFQACNDTSHDWLAWS